MYIPMVISLTISWLFHKFFQKKKTYADDFWSPLFLIRPILYTTGWHNSKFVKVMFKVGPTKMTQ